MLGIGAHCPSERELYVDMIELNHMYGTKADYVFSQVIVWERWPETGRFVSRGFSTDRDIVSGPYWSEGLMYVVVRRNREVIKIRSRLYRQTWTQLDPETASKREQSLLGIEHADFLKVAP
jgi:hypothetical protein